MTTREVYEALLVELNKNFGTPDLLLEDFLHFINKSIFQWTQKRYNVYDTNQQTTDDVQVLVEPSYELTDFTFDDKGLITFAAKELPDNYFHLLNCILVYQVVEDFKCYPKDSVFAMPGKRLTSDIESKVITNAWLRPNYRNPYYKISSLGSTFTTAQIKSLKDDMETKYDTYMSSGTDADKLLYYEADEAYRNAKNKAVAGSQLSITFGKLKDTPDMSGKYDGIFKLSKVYCDYVKYPSPVNLTYEELDNIEDTSAPMEFKDDVCYEIIKEAMQLIMLNTGNPQLQNYANVNTSVPPNPGQQQQQASQ